jgi:hypothetical protein
LFSFNHADFVLVIQDLSTVLKDFIKKERKKQGKKNEK